MAVHFDDAFKKIKTSYTDSASSYQVKKKEPKIFEEDKRMRADYRK